MKFIRSQKNKPQLLYHGYIFNKKTSYQNGNVAWRCADKNKYKCLASLIANGTKIIRSKLEHNHSTRISVAKKTIFESSCLDILIPDCTKMKKDSK